MNDWNSRSLLDLSVGELLQRLGSSEPAPGGGAAAALAGALGAALVQMTANLTIGRPRLADVEAEARTIESQAGDLRQRLADMGDADTRAFEGVTGAYKLPRADDEQKAARSQAIQAALLAAAQVPLETARLCASVLEVAEQAAPVLNAAVISDVVVGAILAHAALEGAAVNVEINLAGMSSAVDTERLANELSAARAGARDRLERIQAAGTARFPRSKA